MMLEDFFTLTEMNNGLTVPSRVKELVEVMHKDSDSVVKNVGEATRQWSAVASAIAATENQDCLSLFSRLDGHHFIGKWLVDALNFTNNSSDSCLEESIVHLLQALGKLHVDYEELVSTDIWRTVKDLLVHNCLKVQEKAQVLFETWERKKSGDASPSDVIGGSTDGKGGKVGDVAGDVGRSASCMLDYSLSAETSVKEQITESTRDDQMLLTSSDALNSGQVESTHGSDKIINPVAAERLLVHADSPSLQKPPEELPVCSSVGANSIESCHTVVPGQDTLAAEIKSAIDTKSTIKTEILVEKVGRDEGFKSSEDRTFHLSTAAANPMRSVTESGPQNFRNNEGKSLRREGLWKIDSDVMDHCSSVNPWRTSNAFTTEERVDYLAAGKSSANQRSLENVKKPVPEDHANLKKLDLRGSDDNKTNDYKFRKKETTREPYLADKRTDIDIYRIVDPLEAARQVAIEVQREVVDFREQSCSSSEKLQEYNEQQPSSPNSVSEKQSKASQGSPKEAAYDSDMSDGTSPMSEESASSLENPDAQQTNEAQDMDNSQVTEVSQGANTEKPICSFDLNQEFCSEDVDGPGNQASAPVSVVSASRAAAVPGLPLAPLQFEGNLGWKGSAATSAFRPASPRRMSESEKDLSTGRSSASTKQRKGFLGIDLNVAEGMDGKIGDLLPDKKLPFSFAGPSGECSVSTSQIRPQRFELDLNCISEDGTCPSDLRVGQFFPQGNGFYSMSHSSSSTSKQPSLKSIDLNDQPSFLTDFSDNSYLSKLPQTFHTSGAVKSDDSVISIMGTRVEVNRKEFVPPNPNFPNGRISELAFDVNMGRTGSFLGIGSVLPYTHSSGYGYHNIAPGPAMPFPSTLYASGGPIPYMVDSRGAPVIPQIIAPATGLPTGFPQTPFFVNMSGLSPSNGGAPVASARSSFDLNSGMAAEGGSRDPAAFTQFLNLGQVRPTDEQLRSNSHVGGKRKEAENAWEHYPFKHHTPPWK